MQRARLRSSIGRVRGHRSTHTPICRRVYNVPGPNCLWHANGNHKLIRYRFVIHAAIDGFSRLLTFINCANNNTADRVLEQFLKGTAEFEVPSRLRTDKGGENVGLWRYMEHVRGEGRSSYITGSSVHNCGIERLWRDVRSNVLVTSSTIFHGLEDAGVLDPDNQTDLFCLHYIFTPRINESLKTFQQVWNSHSLSTECNWSPLQLFTAFSLGSALFTNEVSVDPQTYGIDYEETSDDEDLQPVNFPPT